jgi:Sulfotransferase family
MTMSAEPTESEPERTEGRVPDFFIVGHHKSGTTAMYEMLRRHPQVFMPDMKEPEFFREDRLHRRDAPPRPVGRPRKYAETRPQTYAEYLSLFQAAGPDQLVGEASPSYLFSPVSAGLIAQVQPAARIIAILREPASFLRSLHLQMLRDHVQTEPDLERAMAGEELARGDGRAMRYAERVRYTEQLRRYHDVFAPEQVLVLIYDDFRADNQATMRTILRFLGVEPGAPIKTVDVNPTIAARSRTLDRKVLALKAGRGPVSRGVKATLKALAPQRMRRDVVRAFRRNVVYGSAPAPDETLMLELRRRFKPEVVALSDYLGRDLVSLWGYDGLD